MILVDTHCHLDLVEFEKDQDEVLDRARDAGVRRIIVPGIDPQSSRKAVLLAEKHADVFAAVGIHPHYADKVTPSDIDEIRRLATEHDKVVAIGEIGLDNYRKFSDPARQRDLFEKLVDMASQLDLPVIVHARESARGVMEVLRKTKKGFLKGVMHCFSQDAKTLEEVLSLGLFVSFAGNITYPKALDLRETARVAGIKNILLETDAPYMSFGKNRGKRNEPSFIGGLTEEYGGIFNIDPALAAAITSDNADQLFKLGLSGRGTAVYKIRNSLYINMTHRCSNRCGFCARQTTDIVKGHDLHLGAEPLRDDIMREIGEAAAYDEVVFCGFGEPTLRMGALLAVAGYIKEHGGKVRLNTNGEANLINGRDVTKELEGLVDRASVSVNAPDSKSYDKLCGSVFGERAHEGIKDFITGCVSHGIKVEVSCLDFIGEAGVNACREMGRELGAGFKLRHLDEVG